MCSILITNQFSKDEIPCDLVKNGWKWDMQQVSGKSILCAHKYFLQLFCSQNSSADLCIQGYTTMHFTSF